MERDDYIAAGKIAGEVREWARETDWVGSTVYEMCEAVEKRITDAGVRCAFPVNASINEVAAHYTAEPDDPTIISDGDLVKIDLGAQINGWIADTAVTVNYNPEYDAMVNAAEGALSAAMAMIKDGVKSGDIGRTIERVIKRAGYKPIMNLSGHSIDRYTIHGGRSIPNMWSFGSFSLTSGSAYACEPFVTTSDGLGAVGEGKTRNIYAIASRKKTKDESADRLLNHIWEEYNMLPFARRWLRDYEPDDAQRLLDILVKKKAVKAYPVLIERNRQRVAQAEHTFIPDENGALITTVG